MHIMFIVSYGFIHVLSSPDIEEEEKLFRRQNNHPKFSDPSMFLNFARHSVRAEACDCPPTYHPSSEKQASPPSLPGCFGHKEDSFISSSYSVKPQFLDQKPTGGGKAFQGNKDKNFLGNKQYKQKNKRTDFVERSTQIGEKHRHPTQESEHHKRVGNSGFLRVLFWKFHNFRMLLGSDMLLFSNDKYVAVSLHLWDVTRQVTPLTWLEAWLDNVMASVPELAICYHQNGVVQGYELLKTDDIFLLKGVSEDGTPAFHPQVVQQNGLSVLRFLQENCKQDPGAYWLYKGAGEDVIQLFDLSALPKNHSDDDLHKASSFFSLMEKGRRETMFSLGTLLYRVAHRLSLSNAPSNRIKCAKFFRKCLDFLHERDHLVVRAYAHEQFARLILKCYEELELTSDTFLLGSEIEVTDLEDESSEFSLGMYGSAGQDKKLSQLSDYTTLKDANLSPSVGLDVNQMLKVETNSNDPQILSSTTGAGELSKSITCPEILDNMVVCQTMSSTHGIMRTVKDPVSSKFAAIHHVSQAIKSLRWKRQLQNAEGEIDHSRLNERSFQPDFSSCSCGDVNCIEICDIREWLPKAKLDHKMWNLVLLLGESYLGLGEALKEDGQLHRALKVVKLACLVYGSMPQHLDDALFISSMDNRPSYHAMCKESVSNPKVITDSIEGIACTMFENCCFADHLSPTYLFWYKVWSLLGDVYVEYQRMRVREIPEKGGEKASSKELRMSNEVVREVMRLKKKLGKYASNCSSCFLINCGCQSDRVSSGNNASSSGNVSLSYSRKHNRKLYSRTSPSLFGQDSDTSASFKSECSNEKENCENHNDGDEQVIAKPSEVNSTATCSLDTGNIPEENVNLYRETISPEPGMRDGSYSENGGLFKFLEGPKSNDIECNLLTAIYCYDAARKAINGFPFVSAELNSLIRRKGWVYNELGRYRLDKESLASAEAAFSDAIQAFKEVSDYTNIILINCNLGHGRRSLAEELVSKLDELKKYEVLQNAYKQAFKSARLEYLESLKHYGAAKTELDSVGSIIDLSLHDEVYTQYGHTHLRLGMLLAKEGSSDDHETTDCEASSGSTIWKKDQLMHTMSASDAFREALSLYESLSPLRKQEAAFCHFQLACFHRDNCLKLLDREQRQLKLSKIEIKRQKAKWYASLADKHWQKAIEFYGPRMHPVMYLNILLEQAALVADLSNSFHSNAMLETALLRLLDARRLSELRDDLKFDKESQIESKFWKQLQSLLKNMLSSSLSNNCSNKTAGASNSMPAARVGNSGKLREMYQFR
ncbi:hypothetical protein AXF42_Ash013871 [Apostasia shenzhenica]|uniref:EDRF1 N-terminal domain-containing protein n=1 Tax=Apostasia shenzhenica TaxID=1088818 RepID=A0A2I0AS35_9ASPA|nr:hypothetical protein AXF42_Ash013871 [Apostasia shenzhenica]